MRYRFIAFYSLSCHDTESTAISAARWVTISHRASSPSIDIVQHRPFSHPSAGTQVRVLKQSIRIRRWGSLLLRILACQQRGGIMPPDELPRDVERILLARDERVAVHQLGREPEAGGVREGPGPVEADALVMLRKGDAVPGVVRPPVPHSPPVDEPLLAVHRLDELFLGARVEVELGADPQHRRPHGVVPALQQGVEECFFGLQPAVLVRCVECRRAPVSQAGLPGQQQAVPVRGEDLHGLG